LAQPGHVCGTALRHFVLVQLSFNVTGGSVSVTVPHAPHALHGLQRMDFPSTPPSSLFPNPKQMDEQKQHSETPPPAPPGPAPVAPRRKKRLGLLIVLVLIVVALLLWFHPWRHTPPAAGSTTAGAGGRGRGGGGGRFAAMANQPQSVQVATAALGDMPIVLNALGTVTPLASVTVKTQITGTLTAVAFKEGQMVKAGDFLAQVDPRPYQIALLNAQGALARDQALLKQAQTDLVRYQTLLKQDSISRQQAEDQVFLVQQYQGTVKSDQASIQTAQLDLTYCHITAPVSGRVGLRQVDPGNYVTPGDTNGIVVITQLEPMSVIFTVPEDNLPQIMTQMHAGTSMSASAYDRSNTTLLATGSLQTIDNQIDTTTGTVKLRAGFANKDDMLFPNQFVNIKLLVQALHNINIVPTSAVQNGSMGTFVYVVKADNTVTVRPVKAGPVDGERTSILSGLQPGEKVVIDGSDRLREGAKIVVPGPQPAAGASGASAAAAASGAHGHRHHKRPAQQ
jgi:multidrug efflux system membrane fusion protein